MHTDCASAMTERLRELYPALTAAQLDAYHHGFEHLDADVRLVKDAIDRTFLNRADFNWQRLIDFVKWEADKRVMTGRGHDHDPDAPPISLADASLLNSLSAMDLEAHKEAVLDANPDLRSFLSRSDPRTSPVLRAKILERLRGGA